jgi:hypothetical protein
MSQTGPHLSVRRKPVPGITPVPTVSEDPFWDPTEQLAQVPMTPVKEGAASVAAPDPFADPPPPLLPNGGLLKGAVESGPSRLSTVSSTFDAPSRSSTAIPVSLLKALLISLRAWLTNVCSSALLFD